MYVTQQKFETLINLKKEFQDESVIDLAYSWSKKINSIKTKHKFILDYNISSTQLFVYNKRYKTNIVLVRFDMKRHKNPDGKIFKGPHVHLYKEGYGDKIAFPVQKIGIDIKNINKFSVIEKFLKYCNVINYPKISEEGLF